MSARASTPPPAFVSTYCCTPVRSPGSNGIAEVFVKTFKRVNGHSETSYLDIRISSSWWSIEFAQIFRRLLFNSQNAKSAHKLSRMISDYLGVSKLIRYPCQYLNELVQFHFLTCGDLRPPGEYGIDPFTPTHNGHAQKTDLIFPRSSSRLWGFKYGQLLRLCFSYRKLPL